MRHAFALDQREGGLRARVGRHDDGAAGGEGTEHAGAGQREVERDRQHGEVDGVRVERADLGGGAGVVGVVVVGARDELGQPGGAAGMQQQGQVTGGDTVVAEIPATGRGG